MSRTAASLLAGLWAFTAAAGTAEVAGGDTEAVACEPDFQIAANAWGGCMMSGACPSYRLSGCGKYVYNSRKGQLEGNLANEDRQTLSETFTLDRLGNLEKTKHVGGCPSYSDGTDYSFEISLNGQEFRLDTCEHALSESSLINRLIELFGVFASDLEQVE